MSKTIFTVFVFQYQLRHRPGNNHVTIRITEKDVIYRRCSPDIYDYIPAFIAEAYIVFVFPSVCKSVRMLVRPLAYFQILRWIMFIIDIMIYIGPNF